MRKAIGAALIVFGILALVAAITLTVLTAGVASPPAFLAGLAAQSVIATGSSLLLASVGLFGAGGVMLAKASEPEEKETVRFTNR